MRPLELTTDQRDHWKAAFQNPRPLRQSNLTSSRPDQLPPLPLKNSLTTDDSKPNVKRKAAPMVTPSVIRSVASPYDQRQLGSADNSVPQSLQHLYATADEQGRNTSTLQPTPSLVELMQTAARAENVQDSDETPQQPRQEPLLEPPVVPQGETTIKFNAALAKVRPPCLSSSFNR